MNRALKLGSIALLVAAIAVLLYTAASDKIFFMTVKLRSEDAVLIVADGYELRFHQDKTDLVVATVFHNVELGNGDQASIIFKLLHKDNYVIDSMNLEFLTLRPPSALTLEGGPSFPYDYTRTDDDSSTVFDFPNLSPEGSETISLNFSLDWQELDPALHNELTLNISFSMHEESSLLKIVRYRAGVGLNLKIPSP